MSPKLQEEMLKATIEDLDTQVSGVKEMARAWSSGDVATMEKIDADGVCTNRRSSIKRLLLERNQNWIPHVETCLSDNAGCFVVVGAAHLVGKDGLPTLLAKKGFKVTQQ